MKIVLTFDTGYAPHAATVMESIIQNCPQRLDFALIYYDLTDEVRKTMTVHFENKVNSIEFHKVDVNELKESIVDVKAAEHLKGFNAYLRLFAPQILPNDDAVIYLDCDIVVQDNILNILTNADLTKPLCAVTEYDPSYKNRNLTQLKPVERTLVNPFIYEAYWFRTYQSLGLDNNVRYFNTGVQIMNLKYWRENKITEQALHFLIQYPEKAYAADQDALNVVIKGNYHALEPKWNSVLALGAVFTNYPAALLEEATKQPSVIHEAGAQKPWHYMGSSNAQKLYWKYRKSTPWPKEEYKDKTLKKVIKKEILLPLLYPLRKFIRGRKKLIDFLGLNSGVNLFFAKSRI